MPVTYADDGNVSRTLICIVKSNYIYPFEDGLDIALLIFIILITLLVVSNLVLMKMRLLVMMVNMNMMMMLGMMMLNMKTTMMSLIRLMIMSYDFIHTRCR